jgi:hypothetical protein
MKLAKIEFWLSFRYLKIKPTWCTVSLCMLYFYSVYVSGNYVPIIRRIYCINAIPGICHSLLMTVWYAGREGTRRSSTQSDKYQLSHWYGKFCWWWEHSCPKHVDNRNKAYKEKLCTTLVSFTILHKDARSTKHKIRFLISVSGPPTLPNTCSKHPLCTWLKQYIVLYMITLILTSDRL